VENWGVIIGIAAAVAIVVYLRDRRAAQPQRTRAALVGFAVSALAAAVAVWGLDLLPGSDDKTTLDQAIASARALPMIGVVLDDVPGSEGLLRAALKEEIRQPTTEGVSRPLKLMRELRTAYVVPALLATDDASAAAVVEARIQLLQHLQRTDLVVCKEFALIGIQRSDKLDATGQKLMRDVLAALEQAYRSGRAAKAANTAPPPVASDSETHALLMDAGLSAADFDKLARLGRLSNEEACDIALRFNTAPARLPADKRGPLMRHLLTVQ